MKKIAVLLLSADVALRDHWSALDEADYEVSAASSLEQAQQWATQQNERALVMVDASLVDTAAETWQQFFNNPKLLVAVGSLSPSDPEGQQMIVAGAKAYFHAYSSLPVINTMLQQVQAGYIWVGQSLLSRLLSQVSAQLDQAVEASGRDTTAWQEGLTPREVEVAQRAALGHSNALIAEDLDISERTVRAHLSAVFEKLNVVDRLMLTLRVHGIK